MKRKLSRLLALALCCATILGFSACTKQINQADALNRLFSALEESNKADVYYYIKTQNADKAADKPLRTLEVNLRAEPVDDPPEALPRDESKYFKHNADGSFADYKLSVKGTETGVTMWSWICGPSKGADGTALFYSEWRKDATQGLNKYSANDNPVLSKRTEPLTDFLQSESFAPYTLKAQLAELSALTEEDINFDISTAKMTVQDTLVTLIFAVNEEYIQRYKEENGKDSVFAGTSQVKVQLTYGRVQQISLYAPSSSGVFKSPKETVSWQIFYLGARFTVPEYNQKDEKVAANNWAAANELTDEPKGF
ncbi:MAG: hypothetical protein LBQ80_03985 [Clostridium sp.]|jgi:hypothetical protein|nr:hypothetical protein [Clostridium sp.]